VLGKLVDDDVDDGTAALPTQRVTGCANQERRGELRWVSRRLVDLVERGLARTLSSCRSSRVSLGLHRGTDTASEGEDVPLAISSRRKLSSSGEYALRPARAGGATPRDDMVGLEVEWSEAAASRTR